MTHPASDRPSPESPATKPGLDGTVPNPAAAARASSSTAINIDPPNFLLPWEPRHRIFFRNLRDTVLFLEPPPVHITARPAKFWPDVFVEQKVSTRALLDSALLHIFIVVIVIAFTLTYVTWKPPELHDAFSHARLTYTVSDYLPEIHMTPAPEKSNAPKPAADPLYARQQIISVPPESDNDHQTIVTTSPLKLKQDVPLPNMVSSPPPKPVAVLQVANRAAPKLETPSEIVAPKLKVAMAPPEISTSAPPSAVEVLKVADRPGPKSLTPPEVAAPKLAIGMAMPAVEHGAIPAAAPTPLEVANGRRIQTASSASAPTAAPALKGTGAAPAPLTATNVQPPKPAPAANGNGVGGQGDKQVLAISTNPTPPNGALEIPNGTRQGTFAMSPEGRPNASGAVASTPGKSGGAAGVGDSSSAAGIHISPGASPSSSSGNNTVVAAAAPRPATPSLRERMAAMTAATPTVPPRRVEPQPKDNDETANAVFGRKLYYKLTVNMPNLTSASGSWIIRFAELHPEPTNQQPLAAPVALTKSDPGYPPAAMRDHVEGTVTLYAIIRHDGSITDVKVINSVDELLDNSAMQALHRWRFQPGSRDGKDVDVEAVVTVPFRLKKLEF